MTTWAEKSESQPLENERLADEIGNETAGVRAAPASVSAEPSHTEASREARASKPPAHGGPPNEAQPTSLPSYGLAAVCAAHALVFVAGAVVLPWKSSYAFSLPLFLLAALHVA